MEFIHYNPIHYISEVIKLHKPCPNPILSLYDIYREPNDSCQALLMKTVNPSKIITIPFFIPFLNFDADPKNPLSICIDLKNRIFLETEYLEIYYENINVSVSIENVFTITAEIPKKIKRPLFTPFVQPIKQDLPYKIAFKIPTEYPDLPPDLYINDSQYINIIECCKLSRINNVIKKYMVSKECFCCGTMLKKEIWNSRMMFSDVFGELRKIQTIKKKVKYDILLEELMRTKCLEYSVMLLILEFLIVL